MNEFQLQVLVVSKHFLNKKDAQAQQSRAVVLALKSRGADIDVLCGSFEKKDDPAETKLDVNIFVVEASELPRGNSFWKKVTRKIERNVRSIHLFSAWGRSAAREISALHERNKYDCIISLGLPMDSHIAVLTSKLEIAWVAYFSDPWPEAILPAPMSDFSLPLLTALQRGTVEKVLRKAHQLGFSCNEQITFMAEHYPKLDQKKCRELLHVAPSPMSRQPKSIGRLKIVHAGAIGRERVCLPLTIALKNFAEEADFEIHFAGEVHATMKSALEDCGLDGRIIYHGWVSKEDSLRLCAEADILLVIESEMRCYPFLPSKVADYAAAGANILAITGNASPTARLLKKHETGYICVHDSAAIKAGLHFLANSKMSLPTRSFYKDFSPSMVAYRYGEAVDAAIHTFTMRA